MTSMGATHGAALVVCLALGQVLLGCQDRADAATRPTSSTMLPAMPPGQTVTTLDVSALVEKVRPSVVSIETTREADLEKPSFRVRASGAPRGIERAVGAGFVVSEEGLVATNAHVVHAAASVRVGLVDGRELDAVVLGEDEKLDVALLSVKGASGLPPAALGSSEAVRVGDWLIAIGNPYGLDHTVTLGVVSAKDRVLGVGPFDHLLQTDASINPGSSGGPMFDGEGRVVGMSTVMHSHGQGIGFAVPIDDVRAVIDDLRTEGRVRRGVLGLAFQAISADLGEALSLSPVGGAIVTDVEPAGPSSRAGILQGDVIRAADGVTLGHASELARALSRKKPGDVMQLQILRKGKPITASVVLAPQTTDDESSLADKRNREEMRARARRGLGALIVDAADGGAKIDGLDPAGAGARGLEVGDIVLEANGQAIRRGGDLAREVDRAKKPGTMLVRLRRDGEILYVGVRLD